MARADWARSYGSCGRRGVVSGYAGIYEHACGKGWEGVCSSTVFEELQHHQRLVQRFVAPFHCLPLDQPSDIPNT